jgi:hypothetical protein
MKRCDNLTNMQVGGLVVASFFIKGKCWQQAIKLLDQLVSERRPAILENLRIVLVKHFNEDIGSCV